MLPDLKTHGVAQPGFGLYVHWPFCKAKCPYCDFNSHVRDAVDHDAWRDALVAELVHYAALTGRRQLTSIFFGGGTPSLMEPATVAAVIDRAAALFDTQDDLEITLEANPTSVEAGRFAGYRAAGVNRVSLGVQALNDTDLKALGREHSHAEALAALGVAQKHFDRFSYDLIYARPGQSPDDWRAELQTALSHAADHLSLYQLTIEPGTAFHTLYQRGDLVIPDADTAGRMYEITQEILDSAGMPAYEISNHARAGAQSRHNLVYWRYGDYIGIGPGAHGRITMDGQKHATRAHAAPEIWLDRVGRNGHGAHPFEQIAPQQQAEEYMMMGLRLREGVSMTRLAALAQKPVAEFLDMGALARLEDGGFVTRNGDVLAATAEGRQRLNSLLPMLLA